jgi:heme iron utilization protein
VATPQRCNHIVTGKSHPHNCDGRAMPPDRTPQAQPSAQAEAAPAARHILRTALKASLATLDHETGHPYASLVLIATEPDGSPILLISRLARHTRNLQGDSRASLLLDATNGLGDPLAGGRLTLVGDARPSSSPSARARFLARHPSAAAYAGFADFSVYQVGVAGAHFVGGFGKIVDLAAADLLREVADAQALIAAADAITEHMNNDHSQALELYATELAGAAPGPWRMTGIDPDGIDLLLAETAVRIAFPGRILAPDAARAALVALAQQARASKAARA